MDDPMIIATAIVFVISGIGAAIVTVINAKASADERRDAKASREKLEKLANENVNKADRIIEQGVQIHTLTNSNLSKVTADLATAISKIEGLEKVIRTQEKDKEIADDLARTTHTISAITKEPIPIEIVDENKKDSKE